MNFYAYLSQAQPQMIRRVPVATLLLIAALCANLPLTGQTVPPLPPVIYEVVPPNQPPPTANPGDGIALVEEPTANPSGNVSTSLPIKLPPGRQGMVPVLSLEYSSDHLHGWLGRGWDLTLPTIDVETRWGVPTFDAGTESETYLLEGSMLAPVSHLGLPQDREADRVYTPRVVREFKRIIRKGDKPDNYWWEIAYPDGTVEYYGGVPEAGIIREALLTDDDRNITSWALVRAFDVHGNRIDYHYTQQADDGRDDSPHPGKNRYPHRIRYTGFKDEVGGYEVRFLRDRQIDPNYVRRPDVRMDYTAGFKRVTADLLRRIEVYFSGQPVRHYLLAYRIGAFGHTLLTDVIEYGSAGSEMARHTFTYYDLPTERFSPLETWSTGQDNVTGPLLNPLPSFENEVSALGGDRSVNKQNTVAITFGPQGNPTTKDWTVGGTVAWGKSSSVGLVSMVDIDGDQLPDKVIRTDDGLRWRRNLAGTGATRFSEIRPINGDVREFSISTSKEIGGGLEANITPFAVGYDISRVDNLVTTYFNDFNGDGLLDIGHNNRMYFNRLDAAGNPTFSRSSAGSPNPIVTDGSSSLEPEPIDPAEQQKRFDEAPKLDVVRSWEAPWDGTIDLDAPVRLLPPDAGEDGSRLDGVSVTIQHENRERWRTRIEAGDFGEKIPQNVAGIQVTAGEKIYFRVQSVINGAADRVLWDPVITYRDTSSVVTDFDSLSLRRYQASEDYLLASCQGTTLPDSGVVRIAGPLTKARLTDTLRLEIVRNQSVVHREIFSPDTSFTALPILLDSFRVRADDMIQLRLWAKSNVNWRAVSWRPELTYLTTEDGGPLLDSAGEPLYRYCPAVDYGMFTAPLRRPAPWQVDSGTYTLTLQANTDEIIPVEHNITLTIKTQDSIVAQYDYVFDGTGEPGPVHPYNFSQSVHFPVATEAWVEVTTSAISGIIFRNGLQIEAQRVNPDSLTWPVLIPFGGFRARTLREMEFGPQFRGWGQFVYRAEGEAAAAAIVQSRLRLPRPPDFEEEDLEDMVDLDESELEDFDPNESDAFDDIEDLGGDPRAQNFYVMVLDAKAEEWLGPDELTFLGRDFQSSSRLGEDDVLLSSGQPNGGGGYAPAITSRSIVNGVMAGASGGPLGAALSYANSNTYNRFDIMDMNGDAYPDLVTPTQIAYTNPLGGYSDIVLPHSLESHRARSNAKGITASGGFVNAAPRNSCDSSGKGSSKKARKAKVSTKNNGSRVKGALEAAEVGGSLSAELSLDHDFTSNSWFDVNGDGLSDKVWNWKDGPFDFLEDGELGAVAFNTGYGFSQREEWDFQHIRRGVTATYGGGGGISISNNSIMSGIALSRDVSQSVYALEDLNNDGLVDIINVPDGDGCRLTGNNCQLRVRFNYGTKFGPEQAWAQLESPYDMGDATVESVNFAFTVCFPPIPSPVRVCTNYQRANGRGVSRTRSQLVDIDGDGFLDEVSSRTDNEITVRRSLIGPTNLLKSVERPLGATIEISYAPAASDYGLPASKWLLAETRVNDGVPGDGPSWRKTKFSYEEPQYDRREREFLGYAKTIETELDDQAYRHYVTEYHNNNVYDRNLVAREYTEEPATNARFEEVVYQYDFRDAATGASLPPNLLESGRRMVFPAMQRRTTNYYAGTSNLAVQNIVEISYDSIGQVIERREHDGDPSTATVTTYAYHPSPADHYVTDRPASIAVSAANKTYRYGETTIDERGNVVQQRQYYDPDGARENYVTFDYTYDKFGNVTSYADPANGKGERMVTTVTYDSTTFGYPVRAENSYGYASEVSYDYRFGQILRQKDVNQQSLTYTLDEFGRIATVTIPKDSAVGYSFRYAYFPTAKPAYATNARHDAATERDFLSHTFLDGLGRSIQQQTVSLDGAFSISPTELFDAFDRVVAEYPARSESGGFGTYVPPPAATGGALPPAASYTYDLLDRPVQLRKADGDEQFLRYGFAVDTDGTPRLSATRTDATGYRETTLLTPGEQRVEVISETEASEIRTRFRYDPLGQLTAVMDDGGFSTTYTYDGRGRQIALSSPDAGRTEWTYDDADNILTKSTPNLRELFGDEKGVIRYAYEQNRVTQIVYPLNFQNKVEIAYGSPGAAYNRAGRIVTLTDASGGHEYFYDDHGETVKTIRTLLINESTVRTFVSEAEYDNWGRPQRMGYPDGEWIDYTYDQNGKVQRITGEKDGNEYVLLADARYDANGHLIEKQLGNGVKEKITLRAVNGRPERLYVEANGDPIQDLTLTYDTYDNLISSVQNAPPVAGLGGPLRQHYVYDPLNRLREAIGEYGSADAGSSYTYFTDYDDLHNQTERELTVVGQDGAVDPLLSYRRELRPQTDHPHRIDSLGGRVYDYDANGNILAMRGTPGSYRYQEARWDEENRLAQFNDNGRITRYTYDAYGRRAIKSARRLKGVFTDGAPVGFLSHGTDYVAYVSPFFTATKDGFVKHYYLEDQLFASKRGTGEFNNTYWPYGGLTAGDLNYTQRMNDLTQTVWNYYQELGLPPGPPTLPGYYGQPAITGEPLPTSAGGNFSSSPQEPRPGPVGVPNPNEPPGAPTFYRERIPRDSIGAGHGYTGFGAFTEEIQSFYHTDQVGNVTWVTDRNGTPNLHRVYLPSGEILVEQRRTDPLAELGLNGKQRDGETGLNYFGARYFSADLNAWLSPDPLAESFPGHNPYAFNLHNELRYADPDGRAPFDEYASELEAAEDFARIFQAYGIEQGRNFGANIYKMTLDKGRSVYYYDDPVSDLDAGGGPRKIRPSFGEAVADIHTVSRMEKEDAAYFRPQDFDSKGEDPRRRRYVVNPAGEVLCYDRRLNRGTVVSEGVSLSEGNVAESTQRRIKNQRRRMTYAQVSGNGGAEHTGKQKRRQDNRFFGPSKNKRVRKQRGYRQARRHRIWRTARRR